MRVFLIGGANGGSWVNVSETERRITVPKPGERKRDDGMTECSETIVMEEYFIELLRIGDDKHWFGMIQGMSMSEGIKRLCECYSGG